MGLKVLTNKRVEKYIVFGLFCCYLATKLSVYRSECNSGKYSMKSTDKICFYVVLTVINISLSNRLMLTAGFRA